MSGACHTYFIDFNFFSLFKTVIPSCEKYKNSALYHGAILWNLLSVNIRNIDSFDSFKAHQKKAMKENG